MKLKECPKCKSELGDRWTSGRMLQQYCTDTEWEDCNWVGNPRTPERKVITTFRNLRISDLLGDTECLGIFDITKDNKSMRIFKEQYLDPYIRFYSFADLLKKNVCMDILGLTYEQCYGTDEDKNTLTKLSWDDMPFEFQYFHDASLESSHNNLTAREVMQFVGTEIFRKLYNDVWVDSTIRRIKEDSPDIAIIVDCRFPNEVEGTQKAGGKVIRLTRDPFIDKVDQHESEKALDKDRFDWTKFDAIIDNSKSSIEKQCEQVYKTLYPWGFVPFVEAPQD